MVMDIITEVSLGITSNDIPLFIYTMPIVSEDVRHQANGAIVDRLRRLNPRNIIVFNENRIASFTAINNWDSIDYVGLEVRTVDIDTEGEIRLLERLIKEDILEHADTNIWTSVGHKYVLKKAVSYTGGDYCIYDRLSIDVSVDEEGLISVGFDSSYSFEYNKTIAQDMQKDTSLIQPGITVKDPSCGCTYEFMGVAPFTIGEPNEYLKCSIVDYYARKGTSYKIQGVSPNTKAVLVKTNTGDIFPYTPSRLKRLCTFGSLPANIIGTFKRKVQRKPDDKVKFMIESITSLLKPITYAHLNEKDIKVNMTPDSLGYDIENLRIPQVLFGRGYETACTYRNITDGMKAGGPYRAPSSIELRYFIDSDLYHDESVKGELVALRNDIDSLSRTMGVELKNISLTQGDNGIDYDIIDMKDEVGFRSMLEELSKKNVFKSPTMVIFNANHLQQYYSTVKQVLGGHNSITTQCMNFDKYLTISRKDSALVNILLGVYAKSGICSWVLKEPLHSDCFVGLDISRRDGKDVMGSIEVIGGNGTILGAISSIQGETIESDTLCKIAENTISLYESKYGKKPNRITFHRDGRCFEDIDSLDRYMRSTGVIYDYVEVTKRFNRRVATFDENTKEWRTTFGRCYIKGDTAILCATDPKVNVGMAQPVKIRQLTDFLPIRDIVEDVWKLSFMHIHSTIKTRLPITTHYADLCSTQGLYGYLPPNMEEDFLYFV